MVSFSIISFFVRKLSGSLPPLTISDEEITFACRQVKKLLDDILNKKNKIMRFSILLILFLFLFSGTLLCGQDSNNDISLKLEKLFSGLRENLPQETKIEKNDSVRSIIMSYASSDSVFTHRFSNLRFLGQITSPDSLVKILTWNLIFTDGGNRYFCYIIKRDRKKGAGKVYTLTGFYNEGHIRTDTSYSTTNWYGALYYDLRLLQQMEQ